MEQAMRMTREQYAEHSEALRAMGYRRALGSAAFRCDHYWYKGFRREGDFKGFQVLLRVWDNADLQEKHPGLSDVSIQFEMGINMETPMDVDRVDVMVMKDGLDIEAFEVYCDQLYDAMLNIFPLREEVEP